LNGQESIAYIHSFNWQKHAPGLERIRALLAALDSPQKALKFIHVAGTNGKGSTCAMLASVLQAAGFRVGLNTSPHLVDFTERIRINGEPISEAALANLVDRIRPIAESMEDHPTEFELITALALLYFQEQLCDIVVLETGLGGELDASNVIDTPEVAILTAMGMDHVAQLGPTLENIAAAKAGIIKQGGEVVSYGGCPPADAVFHRVCRERSARLTETDFTRIRVREARLSGTRFDILPYEDLQLPLAGDYQVSNAAVAVTALEVLCQRGWEIPESAIRTGLAGVAWPGRLELLREKHPMFWLDGAHNANGMAAAAKSLRLLLPGKKLVLLLGMMSDKEIPRMLDLVLPLAEAAVTVTPNSPRGMGAEALRQLILARGLPVHACVSVAEAVRTAAAAAGRDGAVCALGSLYLSGDVRQAVKDLL
jgi:dihydrofolate synthase/folylpolyglutamate synthase